MFLLLLVCERVQREPYLMWRSHLLNRQKKLKQDVRKAEVAIPKLGAKFESAKKWHQAYEYSLIANFSVKIEEMKRRRDETRTAPEIVEQQVQQERQNARKAIKELVDKRSILNMEIAELDEKYKTLTRELERKREDLRLSVANNEVKRDEIRAQEKREMEDMRKRLQKAEKMKARLEKWLKDREFLRQCKLTKKQLEKRAAELAKQEE